MISVVGLLLVGVVLFLVWADSRDDGDREDW